MKIRNRLIALFLVVVMICSVAPIANAYYFNDVTRDIGDPFFDAINYMADNRFMSGSGNRFQPNETVSRAMVATVLYYFSRETGTYSSSFTDVSSSAWYYNPVSWAAQKGIMYGTSNTVFNPNGLITREQLMATLYRYAGYRGKARDTTDRVSRCGDYSSISSYAIPAMNWAVNTGLLLLSSPTANIYPGAVQERKWLALCMNRVSRKVLGIQREDRYAFNNDKEYMLKAGNGYYISGTDQNKLYNYIASKYSGTTAQVWRNEIATRMTDPWGGSCLGMSLTTLMDKTGMLAVNEVRGGGLGSTLNNFLSYKSGKPQITNEVISIINYYQLTQYLPDFQIDKIGGNAMSQRLREFVNALKQDGIALFCYSYNDGSSVKGHAVIAYGYSYSNGKHTIRIYDNRDTCIKTEAMRYGTLTISSNFGNIEYKRITGNVEIPLTAYFSTDYSRYRVVDIDGAYNSTGSGTPTATNSGAFFEGSQDKNVEYDPLASGTSVIILDANSEVRIQNAEGELLEFANAEFSGTMQVEKMAMLFSEPMQCALYIPNSEQFRIEQISGDCNIHFLGEENFTAVHGSGIDELTFFADNRVSLRGNSIDCIVTGAVETMDYALARIRGTCENSADFSFRAEEIGISSSNTQWDVSFATRDTYEWASETVMDVSGHTEIRIGELDEVLNSNSVA